MGECGSSYLLNVQLRQFDSAATDAAGGGFYNVAKGNSPPSGSYWRILQMDAINTMTTQQAVEFVLMPNSQVPLTTDLPISMQIIALFRKFLGAIRIAPGHSLVNQNDLTTLSSRDASFAAPIQMKPIIVPPGWCIAAFEVTGTGVPHRMTLRLWYVEVPIGEPIPF